MSIGTQPPIIAYLHAPNIGKPGRTGATRALLVCGILSSVLYLAMDAIAALRYEGYSSKSQTISELSAVGAPTRPMWIVLGFVYGVLLFAFGFGVWASAGGKRALRVVGGLLLAFAIVGLAWPFGPMHKREVLAAGGGTWTDTLHLILGAIDSLLFLVIIGFGAAAFGKLFRLYSFATLLVVAVFGTLVALDAPRVADNKPTPWLGVTERVNVFGSMLWFAVLASSLLRVQGTNRPKTTGKADAEGTAVSLR